MNDLKMFGFERIISFILILSVTAVFLDIFFTFIDNGSKSAKKQKRVLVATNTMTLFYVIYAFVLGFGIGRIKLPGKIFIIIGTIMVVTGAAFNILSRRMLGGYWADHIKIYKDHKIVRKGLFRYVRHPLYGSLMLALYGGSLVYGSYLGFLLVTFIFIPFMAHRAKQEEELLIEEFGEAYLLYKKEVGMFFFKIKK